MKYVYSPPFFIVTVHCIVAESYFTDDKNLLSLIGNSRGACCWPLCAPAIAGCWFSSAISPLNPLPARDADQKLAEWLVPCDD